MTATLIEWSYDSVNGDIVDVYLFPSEILDIPLTEGEIFDMACYDALAGIEARNMIDE
jgi:hypothetical protein